MRTLIESLESRTLLTVLPAGFEEHVVVSGLKNPMAMALAPDGRIFVTEQGGAIRVIKNGALLPTPFATVVTDQGLGEQGALGIALDPDFATNNYVYLNYTVISPNRFQRIVRFTADGDLSLGNSQTTIFDLDPQTPSYHVAGALHFGGDGKLYMTFGDNYLPTDVTSLNNFNTKMIRINPDGSIPTDNPFYNQTTGQYRAIYAYGLRNPYQFAVQPGTGLMYINDVGQVTWEEINIGTPGADYGWPTSEGLNVQPGQTAPVHVYSHADFGESAAITGGAFYNPAAQQFPAEYAGRYFFSDYVHGFVKTIDPNSPAVSSPFATGLPAPIDMAVANDGTLYYISRFGQAGPSIFRINYTGNLAPNISVAPRNTTVAYSKPATFFVSATGADLTYQWQRNNIDIPGATQPTYTTAPQFPADTGTTYRVIIANPHGQITSDNATLTVSPNQAPNPTITAPTVGTTFGGGQTISYAGTATDPEDGILSGSKFTWQVDFHHADHVHPFIASTTNRTSGTFVIPNVGETATDVFYRVILTVTDNAGLTTTIFRDIAPRISTVTLASNVATQIKLDGSFVTTPYTFNAVAGMLRDVEAPASVNSVPFANWSDLHLASHQIAIPESTTTFTATYGPSTSQSISAAADTYVRDGSYASTNFGTLTSIDVKKDAVGFNREGYFAFDLPTITSIYSARLQFSAKLTGPVTGGLSVGLYAIADTTWTETGLTYSNRPVLGELLAIKSIIGTTHSLYDFSVGPYLAAQAAAGKTRVSFAIRALTSGSAMIVFNSRTAASGQPQLILAQAPSSAPQAIVLSTNSLTVTEGASATFTANLATAPANDVIVSVARTGDSDLATATTSLTFTPANWNVAQSITISASEDADSSNDSAMFTLSSPGLASQSVNATESDNDPAILPTVTLSPLADATVRDGSNQNNNYGSLATLEVKKDGVGNYRESYLKFDLSSISAISSAKLRLFGKLSDTVVGGLNVGAYSIDNSTWTEAGLTYASRPTTPSTVQSISNVPDKTQRWIEWDLTTFLQSQKSAGKTLVTLVLKTTTGGALITFNSQNATTHRPELVITQSAAQQAIVVSTNSINVAEGSASSFTVKLAAAPSVDVIVSIAKSGDSELSSATTSLTFTSANWNTPQTVTINAAEDIDQLHGSATFTLSSAGLPNQLVTATEMDNDGAVVPTTLSPLADATIRDGSNQNTNYGSLPTLEVKKDGVGNYRETYLKFHLTSLTTFTTAKLRLFGKLSDAVAGGINVSVFDALDTSWLESSLTYASKPATTGAAVAVANVASKTAAWIEWDLTAYLQAKKTAGLNQISLVLRTTTGGALITFNSDEATASRPQLVIG